MSAAVGPSGGMSKIRMYRRKHLRALAETYKPVKLKSRRGVKSRYGWRYK